jgi:ABC-type transport system substrate-binding protein
VQKISTETKTNISVVNSPILPDFFNFQAPSTTYTFDIAKANALLDKSGFKDNGSGTRAKAINKKPAFQFTSYLKVGSKGTEVTQLQLCLARLDTSFASVLKNETSGNYTAITENAVTLFQQKYLPSQKATGETGKATRDKLNYLCIGPTKNSQPLQFTLVTVNQPQLIAVANILKTYWQAVGVTVGINAVSVTDIKPIIKNRSYDALLYGEALGAEPDLYPFWHSSQKIDPGLNLSSYENKDADKLLKDARETLDTAVKQQKLEQLQNTILADAPALFLYNPDYMYWVSQNIHNINTNKIIDPAKRFSNIANWFINTKRIWK